MTDLMLFATLFATYGVLRGNTAGGPAGQDIFSLKLSVCRNDDSVSQQSDCWTGAAQRLMRAVKTYVAAARYNGRS